MPFNLDATNKIPNHHILCFLYCIFDSAGSKSTNLFAKFLDCCFMAVVELTQLFFHSFIDNSTLSFFLICYNNRINLSYGASRQGIFFEKRKQRMIYNHLLFCSLTTRLTIQYFKFCSTKKKKKKDNLRSLRSDGMMSTHYQLLTNLQYFQ